MQRIRRLSCKMLWLLGLVVFLAACTTRVPELQSLLQSDQVAEAQVAAAQPSGATPTPTLDPFDSNLPTPTNTPNMLTPQPLHYEDTPTPIAITVVLDKAEGLPDSEVWVFIVHRADGRYEEYRLPSNEVPRDTNQHYQEFYETLLQLGPGDELVQLGPLTYHGMTPANPTEQAAVEATALAASQATPSPLPDGQEPATPAAQIQSAAQPTQVLSLPFVTK